MNDTGTIIDPIADDHDHDGDGDSGRKATNAQIKWLQRGLEQPGGKLPLFDRVGQKISEQTVRSCIRNGWAEPWFNNPIKPDWLVCRLTESGREVAMAAPRQSDDSIFD